MPNPTENRSRSRRGAIETDPAAADPRVRGRTYSVAYERVWSAALVLARTLRGWSVESSDARLGEIRGSVSGWLLKRPDSVVVRLSLDEVGLTRVDLQLVPRTKRLGRRVGARRTARFFRALDAALRTG